MIGRAASPAIAGRWARRARAAAITGPMARADRAIRPCRRSRAGRIVRLGDQTMQTTQARSTALEDPVAPRAIAWIDACRASVAGMTGDGLTWTCEIDRGWLPQPAFLAEVARVIGQRRHVVILGPEA